MSRKCQDCVFYLTNALSVIHYSIGQAIQLVRSSIEVFMTTPSISHSFKFVRPFYILNDGTHYQAGIQNADRTFANCNPSGQVLKVPTFRTVRHDRSGVVDCHNLASARAIAEGRAPCKVEDETTFTYNCKAFVSPLGQFYVEIFAGSQIVRMDVANAQTARHYVRNGVDTELACEAYLSNLSR